MWAWHIFLLLLLIWPDQIDQGCNNMRHKEATASSFFGWLCIVYHQSAWSAYKTVRWTVKIAAQNAPKIAILRLKMEKFYAPSAAPSPSGEGDTPSPHLTPSAPMAHCGASISHAYSAPTSVPSAPPLAPAALDHSVPPRVWKSSYGPVDCWL